MVLFHHCLCVCVGSYMIKSHTVSINQGQVRKASLQISNFWSFSSYDRNCFVEDTQDHSQVYFWCSFLCAELCNAKGNIGLLQTHRTPPPSSATQPTLKLMLTMPLSSEIWLHNNSMFEGQWLEL